MDEKKIMEQAEKLEGTYVDDFEDLLDEDSKSFANRCKYIESLVKAMAMKKEAETEGKKIDLEFEKAKIEAEKMKIEKERLENEKASVEATIKDQKKTFWLNLAKIGVAVAAAAGSIYVKRKMEKDMYYFEQYGSARSDGSKLVQKAVQDVASKLDKISNVP